MITITKTASQTHHERFDGFVTAQTWLMSGDVEVTVDREVDHVTINISGGSPGEHHVGFKVSGADPEILDTIAVTVTGE